MQNLAASSGTVGYLFHNVMKNSKVVKSVGGRQSVYGSVPDYMVTRVSYKLNLRGPCMFVQSACSTSLVAVHLGCQSLHNHEADMVLAGGVSVAVPHRVGYLYEDGGMMSPDQPAAWSGGSANSPPCAARYRSSGYPEDCATSIARLAVSVASCSRPARSWVRAPAESCPNVASRSWRATVSRAA